MKIRSMVWLGFVLLCLFAAFGGSGCDCGGEIGQGAELLIEPSSVVFPLTPVGQTSKSTVRLINKKGIELEISQISLSKDSHEAFRLISAIPTPLSLKEGEREIEIEFAPKAGGGASGTLVIVSNASNVGANGEFRIALRSVINAPDPQISCGPVLDFGSVRIQEKKIMPCTLRNRGTAVWTVTKVGLSEGAQQEFFVDAAFPLIIQPGSTGTEIKIAYSPQNEGEDRAQLSFLTETTGTPSDDPPPQVSLRGQSASARIEVVPNALIFAFTSGGKASSQKLTAKSVGEIELTITKLEIELGSSSHFSVDPSISFPLTLAVGKSVELPILYQGGSTEREQGTLLVHSSDPTQPIVRVPLYAVSDGCNLDVTPRKLTFPSRKTITVTLTNQGNRACLLKSITLDPTSSKDYKMIPERWPAVSIAPNQVLEFFVEYRPSDNADDKGKIYIESDDPDEPKITVDIEAPVKVEACELSPNPFVLNYGRTPIGRAASRIITLVNEGLKPCVISEVSVLSVAPPGSTAFLLGKPVTLPVTLQTSQQLAVEVLFSPGESLWYEAALQVKSNDLQRPTLKVKMIGSAAALCIRAVPEQLDLGTHQTSCASPQRTIEIYNLCNVPLNISQVDLVKGGSTEFHVVKKPTLPASLKRGEAISVTLEYRPTDLTQDQGTLRITNDSEALPQLDIPLQAKGTSEPKQTDTFVQSASAKADILFVIDDSFSMQKRQALLAQNLAPFLSFAQAQNVDFRIAVTTTTVRPPTPTTPPGGCFVGTPKLLEPNTPNLLSLFQARVQVGTQGEALEQGLEAAYRALTPPLIHDPNCNLGFLRQDASLSVIFVSDEPDQSPQNPPFYSSFFASLQGANQGRIVRISSIAAPFPPGSCADATSAGRYSQITKQFGGIEESICNSNWKTPLQNLANLSFGLQRQFFLSRPADPKTIQVKINQTAVPASNYSYDATSNSISFQAANTPKPNENIEVSYQATCLP